MTAAEHPVPHVPMTREALGLAPGRGRLEGRHVLVVGGGQRFVANDDPVGIGRAISLLFAREGAHVAVADVNRASAQSTADLILAENGRATVIAADIGDPSQVSAMVATACRQLGRLDGLMLNVGISAFEQNLGNVTVSGWDNTCKVNVRGPMLCCQAALGVLANGASIVFMISRAAAIPGSRAVDYDASKAGVTGLMRHVSLEGAPRGIRANCVAPGLVDTPLGRMGTRSRPERANTVLPFGRQATAWEVAYASLFLMSNESSYISAQILNVDSGLTKL